MAAFRALAEVDERRIARVEPAKVTSAMAGEESKAEVMPPSDDGLRVVMEDGGAVDVGLLFLRPPFLHSPLVGQLGLRLKAPLNVVEADMFHKSSHPLVYVAGDVANPFPFVSHATAQGGQAGAGINHDLASEEWAKAVEAAGVKAEAKQGGGLLDTVVNMLKPAAATTPVEEAKSATG